MEGDKSKSSASFNIFKLALKLSDPVRGQGAIWFKSGAYTIVSEHFEPNRNAAIGKYL
jgi:hypothetical protein